MKNALTRQQWAERIRGRWQDSVECIFDVGRYLPLAKKEIGHGGYTAMIEADLPFGPRTAEMLTSISDDARLTNPNHGSYLPNSWRTLYELTRLEEKEWEYGIAEGLITPEMTRGDIARLKHRLNAPKIVDLPVPEFDYQTVVIDPPWPVGFPIRDTTPNQVGLAYPTMTMEEIAALEMPLAERGHVYLWTTQKFLPHCFDLLEAWGVKYIFTMTWHKAGGFQPFGLPQYNSEFVVFGRRGGLEFLDTKAFPTCFQAPRREHSRKPDEFYDLVRRVSPGPRIDMFSREKREGFDVWGVETDKFEVVA